MSIARRESSLASQIQEAMTKNLELVAVEQPKTVAYCAGPERTVSCFLQVLNSYPPSVYRLPFSVVLLEVLGLPTETRARKRKSKQVMKSIAKVVRRAVGTGDLVLRCAFNRFSLLLLGQDEVSAAKLCERVKHAIHHFLYFHLTQHQHLELDFAIAQHFPCEDDLPDLVFSNERTIRLARALGDGAIVCRSEAKDRFQSHHGFSYRLGESFDSRVLRLDQEKPFN